MLFADGRNPFFIRAFNATFDAMPFQYRVALVAIPSSSGHSMRLYDALYIENVLKSQSLLHQGIQCDIHLKCNVAEFCRRRKSQSLLHQGIQCDERK
jgi:hypothetical protein